MRVNKGCPALGAPGSACELRGEHDNRSSVMRTAVAAYSVEVGAASLNLAVIRAEAAMLKLEDFSGDGFHVRGDGLRTGGEV